MRGVLRGLPVAAALCAAFAAFAACPASAAEWNPPLTIAPSGYAAGVGVDSAGNTTVLYADDSRRWFLVSRPAGGGGFGAPVEVAPENSYAVLAVSPQGRIVVIYQDCGLCVGRLWYRTGTSVNSLSPPALLGERAYIFPRLAVGPGGHAVASWTDNPAAGNDPPTSQVATMGPDGRFGPAQSVGDGALDISVAVNGRGDAVAAWTDARGPSTARAAYRPAGGAFGPSQELGPGAITHDATAVDPSGRATVLFQRYDVLRASQTTGAGFGAPQQIGEGLWAKLIRNDAGGPMAMWTTVAAGQDWRDARFRTLHVADQRPDGSFAPSRIIGGIPAALDPLVQMDGIGNLFTAFGTGDLGQGPLRGAVLTRFDRKVSELSPPLTSEYVREPAGMALGSHGHVAIVYGGFPSFSDERRFGPVYLLERRPDLAPPGIALDTAARRGGRVAAAVRCTESCQAVASLTSYVTKPKRRKSKRRRARRSAAVKSKPVASRPVVIRAQRRGRLTMTLPRKERARLRKLVRRRHRVRIELAVWVADAWGNPRLIRRQVSVKRLLR